MRVALKGSRVGRYKGMQPHEYTANVLWPTHDPFWQSRKIERLNLTVKIERLSLSRKKCAKKLNGKFHNFWWKTLVVEWVDGDPFYIMQHLGHSR